MIGRLDVLYQAIRPLDLEVKKDIVIERYNYRQGTMTFGVVNEDTWLVDEREYDFLTYISHINETKLFLEDSITRFETAIYEMEDLKTRVALLESKVI